MNLDLQQRACEYSKFWDWDPSARSKILERLPPLTTKEPIERLSSTPALLNPPPESPSPFVEENPFVNIINTEIIVPVPPPSDSAKDLQNLLNPVTNPTVSPPPIVPSTTESILNLFTTVPNTPVPNMIFGPPGVPVYSSPINPLLNPGIFPPITPIMPTPIAPSLPMFNPITEPVVPPQLSDPAFPPLVAYQSAELTITFYFKKPNPSALQYTLINVVFTNNSGSILVDLGIQAAPPRHVKFLQETISARNVNPGGSATQVIKASNSLQGQKPLSMKLRITYSINSQPRVIDHVCKDFPNDL